MNITFIRMIIVGLLLFSLQSKFAHGQGVETLIEDELEGQIFQLGSIVPRDSTNGVPSDFSIDNQSNRVLKVGNGVLQSGWITLSTFSDEDVQKLVTWCAEIHREISGNKDVKTRKSLSDYRKIAQKKYDDSQLKELDGLVFRLHLYDRGLHGILLDQHGEIGKAISLDDDQQRRILASIDGINQDMRKDLLAIERKYILRTLAAVESEELKEKITALYEAGVRTFPPSPARLRYLLTLPYREVGE